MAAVWPSLSAVTVSLPADRCASGCTIGASAVCSPTRSLCSTSSCRRTSRRSHRTARCPSSAWCPSRSVRPGPPPLSDPRMSHVPSDTRPPSSLLKTGPPPERQFPGDFDPTAIACSWRFSSRTEYSYKACLIV